MTYITEFLKKRELALEIARDAELLHRWEEAMKIRADASINVGWYNLWNDIAFLLDNNRHSYTISHTNVRGFISRIIGSTTIDLKIYTAPYDPKGLLAGHAIIVELKDSTFAVLRINALIGLRHADDLQFIIAVWQAKTAGDALSHLIDEERDRMIYR